MACCLWANRPKSTLKFLVYVNIPCYRHGTTCWPQSLFDYCFYVLVIVFKFSFPGLSFLLNTSFFGLIFPEWISTDLLNHFSRYNFLSNFLTFLYATGLFSVLRMFISSQFSVILWFKKPQTIHFCSSILFHHNKDWNAGMNMFVCFFRWLATKFFALKKPKQTDFAFFLHNCK